MKLRNILLIDDDTEDAAFFEDAIRMIDKHIVVVCATGGQEAIRLLSDRGDNALPDIVFMDINMPMMDGWETLRNIKQLLANFALPIVMYSSMSFEHVGVSPLDLGAAAFMTKPDSVIGLENGLRELFDNLF